MASRFSFVDVDMSCLAVTESAAEITAAFAGRRRLRLSFFASDIRGQRPDDR
jgi:hypothetical protein